ncbi:MAG: tripartite tricarboxylate transporter permease [Armatimonadota bacterium]|nr:tripartite tricarboxylate transporter permease [Armatimonadota bacterium]MDR7451219.1 tripartite tricarboxylate transporter permease [Armatimonadota bacterium]MDR7467176.1 tripartite tricarboxylate transporter permease [Armatimonadota bacterium]MDR7495189.1 tripartite tricarboxylate transporter permease [Armatimonadota bacterium]MDR7500100.1 tripartite tricarboxylate transporter permease [Armatimonadota bacterium]
MLDQLRETLPAILTSPVALVLSLAGSILGIILGALPGISSTTSLAVLLPLTFALGPTEAMMFLMGVFNGSVYGGSISAILLKIPGTPGAIVTQLDGHPMAMKGRAGEAIGYATLASMFGGLFGLLVFMTVAPLLAALGLKFQSPEFTGLALLGLASLSAAIPEAMLKGILAGAAGLLLATVGLDPLTNVLRFDFGSRHLAAGVPVIPVAIGIFGLAEVFRHLEGGARRWQVITTIRRVIPPWAEMRRTVPGALRGAVVGVIVGIIPAAGSAIGVTFSYLQEKRLSATPERFGTGIPEGIVPPESSNNACMGGDLIPTMSLGVPGDSITAVLMGALLIQGLRPGPQLFTEHRDFVAAVYVALGMAIALTTILGLLGARLFAWTLRLPRAVLLTGITGLCVVGAYAVNNALFDVWMMVFFGGVGYLMQKAGFPVLPLIFGLILGPMFEENLRRTLIVSNGSLLVYLQRPLSVTLLVLAAATATYPLLLEWRHRRRAVAASATAPGQEPAR